MNHKSHYVLLLALSAIGTGIASAQTLGAIPVPVGANPAFIQTSQTPSMPTNAAPAANSSQTVVKANPITEAPVAAKQQPAQDDKPKVVATAQPSAEKPVEPGANKTEVNPMTGKATDIETLTHDYEVEKIRAAIATEKQKRVTAERAMNDQAMPPPLAAPIKAPLVPQASNGLPPQMQEAPQVAMKPVKMPKVKQVPVMPHMATLAGTMMQNGERFAILEQGGETAVVKQGQTAFGQQVGRVAENSVTLGGMMLSSQSANVMRVARTDIQNTPTGTVGSMVSSGPLPAPLAAPGINPSLPMTIPIQGQAPVNTTPGMPANGPMVVAR